MSDAAQLYDTVIGLEVHIQLHTKSKLFSTDMVQHDSPPNANVNAITAAHPGTLPSVNAAAIDMAVLLGLAVGGTMAPNIYFSRKHYLYPDLPKGYQTTQHQDPIVQGGSLTVSVAGQPITVAIHHIHLEEDAGKSIHDVHPTYTAIDLNRAGTPLCELVTEPCLHSAEEAYQFLTALRKLVRWIGVSQGNMEEGNIRCDVNVSLKPKGSTELGTRVEVKNVNSIRYAKKAIEIEVARLTAMLHNNEVIVQETRGFDAEHETTYSMRTKEDANDYRYFTCPDLAPILLTTVHIEKIKNTLPQLPHTLVSKLIHEYTLTQYDAEQLTESVELYNYFVAVNLLYIAPKTIANLILGPVSTIHEATQQLWVQPCITTTQVADIAALLDQGSIAFNIVGKKLLPAILNQPNAVVIQVVHDLQLLQATDDGAIKAWVTQAIATNPGEVAAYRKGKKNLIGFFMGQVKKLSNGKAEPKLTQQLLLQQLDEKATD